YKIDMPTSAGPTLRVYPPKAANDLYTDSSTYGGDNAFDSGWEGFWAPGTTLPESTTTLEDLTGNGNDATLSGGILNSANGTAGPIGRSLAIGSNQYLEIGSGHGLTNQFTFSIWFANSAGITVASPFPHPLYFDINNYNEMRSATRHNWGGVNTGNLLPFWAS